MIELSCGSLAGFTSGCAAIGPLAGRELLAVAGEVLGAVPPGAEEPGAPRQVLFGAATGAGLPSALAGNGTGAGACIAAGAIATAGAGAGGGGGGGAAGRVGVGAVPAEGLVRRAAEPLAELREAAPLAPVRPIELARRTAAQEEAEPKRVVARTAARYCLATASVVEPQKTKGASGFIRRSSWWSKQPMLISLA